MLWLKPKTHIDNKKNHILVRGIYKDVKLADFLFDDINEETNLAIKIDSFNGTYGRNISVYTSGTISKAIIVGLGNQNKLTNDKLRALGAKISSQLNNDNVTEVSIDADSFDLDNSEKGQAFSEGLILVYKSRTSYEPNGDRVNSMFIETQILF